MKFSPPDRRRERGARGPASRPGHGFDGFGRTSAVRIAVGLCLVMVVSGVVIFEGLGRASFHGDESIYALVARQSVESGEWFPFHTARGGFYLNKPPAKIFMVIAGFRFFGEREIVARFPDAISGVVTVAVLFVFAARRFGVATGVLASIVLLGAESYLTRHGVRDSVMDSLVTLLAVVLCVSWVEYRGREKPARGWWLIAAVIVVVASLTKHLMGVVFALVIVVIELLDWLIYRKRPRAFFPALGLLAMAVAGGVAYFLVTNHLTEGLFAKLLYRDIVVRATVGLGRSHLHGPFFYLLRIGRDFGLWLLLIIPGVVGIVRGRAAERRGDAGLFFLWALIWVGGFSLSVSKLPWYVYPAYPALSLVIALGAREVVNESSRRILRTAVITAIVLAAVIDLHSSWLAVRRDKRVLDAERFVSAYSRLASAELIIDAPSIREHGRLRTWNRFYLEGAPNSTWFDAAPVVVDPSIADCVFVATGDVTEYRQGADLRWRTIMRFRRFDRLAGDIWVVGTCDLEVPWALGRDEPVYGDVVHTERFEGGDAGGSESIGNR